MISITKVFFSLKKILTKVSYILSSHNMIKHFSLNLLGT